MRKTLVVVMFVMLIVPFSLLAQFEGLLYSPFFVFEPEIVDAKGAAMGRTTVLTTSGSNAIFTNPAGLGMLEEQVFQGGMRFFLGKITNDYKDQYTTDEERTMLFHMKFNHASFAIPYQFEGSPVKTTFAAGYRTYYDLGLNLYNEVKDDYNDYEETIKFHGGLNTLTFGGALNFNDRLYAGFAVNIGIMGKGSWEVEEKQYGNTETSDGDATSTGSFFTMGCIYKASPRMSLGLMYRPGFEAKFEQEDDSGNTEDADVIVPGLFAVSAEFAPSEVLSLVFEYQSRGLGDYEDDDNNDLYYKSENGSSIRLGTEISVTVPIRFGFYMDSVPVYDIKSSGDQDEAPKSLMGFTGGVGLPLSPQMDLGLYGEYAFISAEDKYEECTYDANRIKFGFTFTYRM